MIRGRPRKPKGDDPVDIRGPSRPGRRGTRGADPSGVGELWAPPPDFSDAERAEWTYALEHAPPGLLTATDRSILVAYVRAVVLHARAGAEVAKCDPVFVNKNGYVQQNPWVAIMHKAAAAMRPLAGELGFTPSSRAALGNRMPEPLTAAPVVAMPRKGRKLSLVEFIASKPDAPKD